MCMVVCECVWLCVSLCVCERSEEHTSELQSYLNLVCRLLLEKKKNTTTYMTRTRDEPTSARLMSATISDMSDVSDRPTSILTRARALSFSLLLFFFK